MSNRAVIVVDLQKEYFASGKLPLVGIDAAATNAAKVIEAGRAKGDTIIHIRHEFPNPEAPFFIPGTEGVEISPLVRPNAGEIVLVKNHPNPFRGTALKNILDENGVKEVVVVGAMSHMCIAATARAATDFGYNTQVVHDACATMDLEFGGVNVPAAQVHAANMSAIGFAYGKTVGTDEFIAGA